ncbi:hypothetical protein NGM10_16925 (plasmid) [Halorussus salilacus]|uniref:hypothetical protein n=1 Tax=Halorussus salilacus TaxID=2953750 RepID=UPI00209E7F5F|nr:hypothetical protein [Halorussus salilacus]USZ69780.1 hypothetical protein NGM10_16925 [Halorussus salilacus]
MTDLTLPDDLRDRYEPLADRLDGFDDAADLARYVLDGAADELERDGGVGAADAAVSADDEVVEDRLEQLGYLEK